MRALASASMLVVASCIASSSAAQTIGSARQPIVAGAPAPDRTSVVLVRTAVARACSGTLVAPTKVVTAAHCTWPTAALAIQRASSSEEIAVARVDVDPAYDERALVHDVAVLTLARPVTDAPSIAVDPTPPHETEIVTLAGFGITARSDASAPELRAGDASISIVDATTITLQGPTFACVGDSGGAVMTNAGGAPKLLAVISAGDPDCTRETRATRLDADRAFVTAALAEDDWRGVRCSTSSAGRASPDVSGVLVLVVGATLVRRRRRP